MDTDQLVFFLADFDYRPPNDRNLTIAYKAGMEVEVCGDCAARAIAKGRAILAAVAEDDLFEITDQHADEIGDDD